MLAPVLALSWRALLWTPLVGVPVVFGIGFGWRYGLMAVGVELVVVAALLPTRLDAEAPFRAPATMS